MHFFIYHTTFQGLFKRWLSMDEVVAYHPSSIGDNMTAGGLQRLWHSYHFLLLSHRFCPRGMAARQRGMACLQCQTPSVLTYPQNGGQFAKASYKHLQFNVESTWILFSDS